MEAFILILYLVGSHDRPAIAMHEFKTEAACAYALVKARSMSSFMVSVKGVCVPQ